MNRTFLLAAALGSGALLAIGGCDRESPPGMSEGVEEAYEPVSEWGTDVAPEAEPDEGESVVEQMREESHREMDPGMMENMPKGMGSTMYQRTEPLDDERAPDPVGERRAPENPER
ncbi:MAG TPA: hypothetical protein VLT59_17100 [Steroidobacteraceae bacterium]|nr:hypothetical protein [Steroidobacteraceae bacterium]